MTMFKLVLCPHNKRKKSEKERKPLFGGGASGVFSGAI
jgi:hypothetical protein